MIQEKRSNTLSTSFLYKFAGILDQSKAVAKRFIQKNLLFFGFIMFECVRMII